MEADSRPPSQARHTAPALPVTSWSWSVRTYLPRMYSSSSGSKLYCAERMSLPMERLSARLP